MVAIPEMGVHVINHHISWAWSRCGDVLDTVTILCWTSAKSVILHIDCFVYSVGFSKTIVLYCIVLYVIQLTPNQGSLVADYIK